MSLHELLLLAGLVQVEVNGVSIVRLAWDAAQGGLGALIAVAGIASSVSLLNLRLETNDSFLQSSVQCVVFSVQC